MQPKVRIALAVGLGYVLGRRRKLRWALTLGSAAAAGRLSRDPQLLRQGLAKLTSGAGLGQLSGLTGPLAQAGRMAATAAVSHGIDSVGGRLRQRADSLRSRGGGAEGQEVEEQETEEAERTAEEGGRAGREIRRTVRKGARREQPEPEDEYDEDEYDVDEDEYDEDEEQEAEPPRRATRTRAGAAPVRRRGGDR